MCAFAALAVSVSVLAGTKAYVSKTGSNTSPYDTWATAANDLSVALAAGTDEIEVGNGTFTNSVKWHVVDRAVWIHSSNGPSSTTLTATGGHFKVSNSDALISGFTLRDTGIIDGSDRYPFNLSAGTISNCVVTGKLKRSNYAAIVMLTGTAKLVDCDLDGSGLVAGSVGWDACCAFLYMKGYSLAERCRIHDWKMTSYPGKTKDFSHCAVVIPDSTGASCPTLRNCLVYNNQFGNSTHTGYDKEGSCYNGGGIAIVTGVIEGCTVVGNSCGGNGGGIYVRSQYTTIKNCIVWGNTSYGTGKDIYSNGNPYGVTYTCASDIGNATSFPKGGIGAGCISDNPKFRKSGSVSYYLRGSSPCIAAGNPAVVSAGALDLLGNPRLKDGKVDMGCYETYDIPGVMLLLK